MQSEINNQNMRELLNTNVFSCLDGHNLEHDIANEDLHSTQLSIAIAHYLFGSKSGIGSFFQCVFITTLVFLTSNNAMSSIKFASPF